MKKLYECIEDINIKGNPAELTSVVSAMDISLQNITAATEVLAGELLKYSESNKGTQYQRVISALTRLREELYESSVELNEMQNQVVAYQNKIFRFEDMSEMASAIPNSYMVNRTVINVDISVVKFSVSEMMSVSAELKNYSEVVFYHTKNLCDSKNQIASIWMDSQYQIFSEFIDSVCAKIVDALKLFDEYVVYLDEKIKELS